MVMGGGGVGVGEKSVLHSTGTRCVLFCLHVFV